MRQLIINADDLGMDAARNHGIFDTLENGAVSSATLLTGMASSQRAILHAKHENLPIGLHFNISEGSPICKQDDVHTLVNRDGFFWGKDETRRELDDGRIKKEHIERELRAQMEWFIDHRGESPTHLDGHHHLHVHPLIAPLIGPVLENCGVLWVRVPEENPNDTKWDLEPERIAWMSLVSKQAAEARKHFHSQGLRTPDNFRGMAMVGESGARKFRNMLAAIPDGITEVMVHPGMCDPMGTEFSRNPQRETEMRMLMDPELKKLLQSQKIELVSFRDII